VVRTRNGWRLRGPRGTRSGSGHRGPV